MKVETMKNWVEIDLVENAESIDRQYRRGCNRRGISKSERATYRVVGICHSTDRFTTLAVVTLGEVNPEFGREPHIVRGYGTSVRSVSDKFRAEIGIKNALDRAFESAATVMEHQLYAKANATLRSVMAEIVSAVSKFK